MKIASAPLPANSVPLVQSQQSRQPPHDNVRASNVVLLVFQNGSIYLNLNMLWIKSLSFGWEGSYHQ